MKRSRFLPALAASVGTLFALPGKLLGISVDSNRVQELKDLRRVMTLVEDTRLVCCPHDTDGDQCCGMEEAAHLQIFQCPECSRLGLADFKESDRWSRGLCSCPSCLTKLGMTDRRIRLDDADVPDECFSCGKKSPLHRFDDVKDFGSVSLCDPCTKNILSYGMPGAHHPLETITA